MSEQAFWTYVAGCCVNYDRSRSVSAEERWNAAARNVIAVQGMLHRQPELSMATVVERYPDFREQLEDAGYPGYVESDLLGRRWFGWR